MQNTKRTTAESAENIDSKQVRVRAYVCMNRCESEREGEREKRRKKQLEVIKSDDTDGNTIENEKYQQPEFSFNSVSMPLFPTITDCLDDSRQALCSLYAALISINLNAQD